MGEDHTRESALPTASKIAHANDRGASKFPTVLLSVFWELTRGLSVQIREMVDK